MGSHTQAEFPETRWTKVLAVRSGDEDSEAAQRALAELCESYWYPIYAFARRMGRSPHDAEDLTQAFFERVLSRELFAKAERDKGRLRSFLLGAFKKFSAEHQRDAQRLKRGGQNQFIALDDTNPEELYAAEVMDALAPELQFERSWAQALLRRVLAGLEKEYARRKQSEVFERLHGCLTSPSEIGGVEMHAQALGMNPGAVRVAVHRMRERYRRALEEEIAHTVQTKEDVADELRHLARVFATTADGH